MILVAILVLGILIFVHELGHFLVAKWNNVGVLEFAIGFGKKIWKKQVGETSYSIGLIPLGGYVRMVGDDPTQTEAKLVSDVNASEEEPTPEQRRLLEDTSRWFLTQGFWAKASIVIAGPAFNLIFAVLLAIGSVYAYGRHVAIDQPIIGDVVPGLPAEKAGLKAHDRVVSINGNTLATWEELAKTVLGSNGEEMTLEIERKKSDNAQEKDHLQIKVTGTSDTPELDVLDDAPRPAKQTRIGIVPDTKREKVSFVEAVQDGALHVWTISEITWRGLKGMVMGHISRKNIAGPIFILSEAANRAERGLDSLFDFMILLNVSLAILNLLPIPVLDGGHLMFFILEAIRRKPLSIRVQQVATQVGMAILLVLMLFAVSNDVLRKLGLL